MTRSVLVVGVGVMGSQIAFEYALGGANVFVLGRTAGRSDDTIDGTLEQAREMRLWSDAHLQQARQRVRALSSASELPQVDLVVESLPEDLDTKVGVMGPIVAGQPGATIATNTSSLSVSTLGEMLSAPERIVATHYWNPPLLAPLVEVVPGERTALSIVDGIVEWLVTIGKQPLVLEREVAGFVWNRLQGALLREALWLVDEGVATPAVIDEVIRSGLARRYRHIGIFEAVTLGGPKTWEQVCRNLFPQLSSADSAPQLHALPEPSDEELISLRRRRDALLAAELRERGNA
jgi:3-hydroxybutyryl-CoA dehydrogenase